MNKKKIIIITIFVILGLIFLDFFVALSFNNSPIIKVRDYYNDGSTVYKDKGIFTNTYKCYDGNTKTVLKTTKYVCQLKESKKEDKKETITITFDTKGGSKIDSVTIKKGDELTLPQDPTLDGYVFKGWVLKNETPIYDKVILLEDTTLYAVWDNDDKSNTITITFDTKGGSKIDSITIKKDTELTLPKDPTFKGYTFKGWVLKNETPIYNKAILLEDTTLYAVWEKVEDKNNTTIIEKTNTKDNKNNQDTSNSKKKADDRVNVSIEKTQAQKNDDYRKNIQNKYLVKIAYKDELGNYTINGYGTAKLYDDNEINTYLTLIDKALAKYPSVFFKEIKDFGMPLTIYLVKSISGNVSGLTDAQYKNDIKIMIEPAILFESTLHHEIMHYIDSYITVKGYPIDINATMKDVNPVNFTYGDKSNNYVYYYTNVYNAYFLSVYGKTNYLEDRAVIFSDLMSRSFTKDCYEDGTPINKKARLISSQIKSYFSTLSSTEKYYWDRFI